MSLAVSFLFGKSIVRCSLAEDLQTFEFILMLIRLWCTYRQFLFRFVSVDAMV